MKLAETVTFGGSALDRAAELRGSAQGQPQAGDQVILLWRGKILVDKAAETPLVRLRLPQPLTVGAPWVFLGQEAGQRIFAFDISSWSPNDQDLPPEGAFNDPSEQYHPELAERAAILRIALVYDSLVAARCRIIRNRKGDVPLARIA